MNYVSWFSLFGCYLVLLLYHFRHGFLGSNYVADHVELWCSHKSLLKLLGLGCEWGCVTEGQGSTWKLSDHPLFMTHCAAYILHHNHCTVRSEKFSDSMSFLCKRRLKVIYAGLHLPSMYMYTSIMWDWKIFFLFLFGFSKWFSNALFLYLTSYLFPGLLLGT